MALAGLTMLALAGTAAPAGACTRVGGIGVGECRRPPSSSAQKKSSDSPETILRRMLNDERRSLGIRTLRSDKKAQAVAEEHARRMARKGRIYHNPELGTSHGRQRLGNPTIVGENVGVGPSARAIHSAFMRSDRHRRNIVHGDFRRVGIGAVWRDGNLWVVEIFLSRSSGASAVPATSAPRRTSSSQPVSSAVRRVEATDRSPAIRGMEVGSPTVRAGTPLEPFIDAVRAASSNGTGSWLMIVLGATSAVAGIGILRRRRPQMARTRA